MSMIPSASGLPNPYDITAGHPGNYPDSDQRQMYPPVNPSSTQRIAQMARLRLRDLPRPFLARQVCSGVAWRFELPVENIDSMAVVLTDTTEAGTTNVTPGQDFQADDRGGILTFTQAPAQGLLMLASGTYYRDLLPAEMDLYVRTAYIQHTFGSGGQGGVETLDSYGNPIVMPPPLDPVTGQPITYGTPAPIKVEEVEEYPISLLVANMALWDMCVGAAQQHDIHTPDGVSIPNSQVFEQLTRMIGMLESEYMRLSAALGVGLFRITQSKLRRVSKMTKRLVPIYRDQEYDDLYRPQRSLPPIDSTQELVTYQGLWTSDKAYHQNDLVDYNGQRYLALQDSTDIDPSKDVDPKTAAGYFWQWSTINTGWIGYW